MKTMKSVLTAILALCLMLCLAVPAFATEVEETPVVLTSTEPTGAADENETIEVPAGESTDLAVGNEASESGEDEAASEEEKANEEAPAEGEGEDTTTTGSAAPTAPETAAPAATAPATDPAAEKKAATWKTVRTILTVLEVIASVIMVIVILFQSGKEAGLSGAISGNNDSYASKTGSLDKKLAKATKWVAIAWLVLTLALNLIP